jgi:hypothetical protein
VWFFVFGLAKIALLQVPNGDAEGLSKSADRLAHKFFVFPDHFPVMLTQRIAGNILRFTVEVIRTRFWFWF